MKINIEQEEIEYLSKKWGYEKKIIETSEYCGKVLYMSKDRRTHWQYHEKKHETFYVNAGKILLKYSHLDDSDVANSVVLSPGDKFTVEQLVRHQLIALEDSQVFEFSNMNEEKDIIVIEEGHDD